MRRFDNGNICRAFLAFLVVGNCVPLTQSQSKPTGSSVAAKSAYREGEAALNRQDLETAKADFEKAVRIAPNDEPALAALGGVLFQQGQVAEAAHMFEAARALSKADLNTEINLALAYQQLDQQAKAVPLFAGAATAARLSKQTLPSFVRAAYARALAATGKLPDAALEMQAAVKAAPQSAPLLGDLGSIYAQQKSWAKAESAFRDAIAIDPNSAIAHLRLGLAMQAQSEPGALQELDQAAQLAPNDAAIQLAWGKALAISGDDAQAIPVLEHAIILQPGSEDAMNQLAQAYQRAKRVPEAIGLFKKVLAIDPKNAILLTNFGMAYAQMQRAKDAVPLLQSAVELDPKNVTAHEDLAAAYVQLSRFGDATRELRVALKLAPDSPQLYYNLGLALKNEDDAAQAIPELQHAEKLDATAPEAPYLLGVLYMQGGRYAEASRELQTSLRLRPENGDGWATLGSVYNKLDQLPDAVNALHEAIKQLPQQPDPHLTLAAVLTKQGLTTDAVAERKQAATLMRTKMNRQRAEVATNSGKALLKSGDVDGAMLQFQDALGFDAQYAEAHLGLASVYDAKGKAAEAAQERQKAAEDESDRP
jgi:protein O-GlcNAc transferase